MSSRKSILLGVTHFQSTVFYRGFITVLREEGADVHVVSAAPAPGQDSTHLEGATFHALAMDREISPVRDLKSLFNWIQTLRKIRPDVIAVGTPKAGLLGTIAGWLLRVPRRIYVVRGLRLETEGGVKRRVLLAMERLAAFMATEVQYVSNSLMETCLELKIGTRSKGMVIGKGSSNGVDLKHFSRTQVSEKEVEKLQNTLGLSAKYPTLGFIGRMVKDKGIDDLIQALKILAQRYERLQVVLIGRPEADDVLIDKPHLQSLGIEVITTGAIFDVRPYYALMDVFVLPTLREGFPNVALEARAMEVPVVTTTATGAVDSIDGGEFGFLAEVSNPRSLAKSIQTALDFSHLERCALLARSLKDLQQHYERTTHQHRTAKEYLR